MPFSLQFHVPTFNSFESSLARGRGLFILFSERRGNTESLPCMVKYLEIYLGNISTVCIFLSISVLLMSKSHKNINIWTGPGSATVWSLSWRLCSCRPRWSWALWVLLWFGLSWSEFQAWTLRQWLWLPNIWSFDGFHLLTIDSDVTADAIGVVGHQSGLLSTDLHAVCGRKSCQGRSNRVANSTTEPARPSMSSPKRKFEIVLPPILTVYLWSSSASAMILSRNMLKRLGESRQPYLTPTVVLNQSPVLPFKQTALVPCIELLNRVDKVCIDIVQPHSCPKCCVPHPVECLFEVNEDMIRGPVGVGGTSHKVFWGWRSAL